jgi:A/G-specific adenine glycosylase
MTPPADPHAGFAARLLAWYDRHRRGLPWRAAPGERADPYRVWLSEIMLQQTTVATVGPYFAAFLERWPTVEALAAAALDDVLHAWQGLGYYARARNLHAGARAVVERHDGRFPADLAALRALPGVGDYTAAAVAAIAFDIPAAAMDGNIERVVARQFDVGDPLPGARRMLRRLAAPLMPDRRPGDYTQALMDLGATICTPRKPRCMLCPVSASCAARVAGTEEARPVKAPKKARPHRYGVAFWAVRETDGAVLLRRRPDDGLLGGMMEVPSSAWTDAPSDIAAAAREAPVAAEWRRLPGTVMHGFSHFEIEFTVLAGRVADGGGAVGRWVPLDQLGDQALPTAMKRVVRHALRETAAPFAYDEEDAPWTSTPSGKQPRSRNG